ncbi:MAG: NIL domain-containing protein [Candidatus Hydrogenedentes bacterium]|nr:NIL domain-containing protein [Candidatus Hydrogenedentota bacterium]MCH7960064.1 NIL domain-containing protein [Candidatus Hydrogenedentota bacterium]
MASRRVYLTFSEESIKEPLIYQLGHSFKVVTNIRGATISKTIGLVALEVEGEEGEIDSALEWIVSKGVKVEPIEKNVIE